jgi:GTP pyrophosphokinase
MTETTQNTASLRTLLPRIFSRAQPSGAVDRLIKTVRTHHPKADIALVERAYAAAERAHAGQKRKSGEPYITHPVAVAQILADLGIGAKTIAAALLHDTVEDTEYTLDLLRRDFGDEIAMLVDGVTKLDKLKYGDSAQAETVRKMIVAMSKDIRVLVIKLADRLHNARTWGFVEESSATRKAQETLEIYAPLAHRLGIQAIKLELEDLSFAVLHPKLYVEIESLVSKRTPQREQFVQSVIDAVNDDLKASKIKGSVAGRPKQYYSIYQKMIVRGRDFDEIYDLVGIRVLVNSVRDCYAVLGSIHARWNPIPGRFKDYIATPKFNLYQSLHTTVIGPQGKAVEIQIRTQEMHQRAEFGVASTAARAMTVARCGMTPTWRGSHTSPTGKPRRKTRGSSSTVCASRSARRRSTSSPLRARSSACPRGRRPSTSRMPCTPRSATEQWVPRSTVDSCRSRARSTVAIRSKSSRRRTPTPRPVRTG